MDKLFNTSELAALLGVTPQTIRNLQSTQPDNFPPAYRFGKMRRVFFREEDVQQLLKARQVAKVKQQRSSKK